MDRWPSLTDGDTQRQTDHWEGDTYRLDTGYICIVVVIVVKLVIICMLLLVIICGRSVAIVDIL